MNSYQHPPTQPIQHMTPSLSDLSYNDDIPNYAPEREVTPSFWQKVKNKPFLYSIPVAFFAFVISLTILLVETNQRMDATIIGTVWEPIYKVYVSISALLVLYLLFYANKKHMVGQKDQWGNWHY